MKKISIIALMLVLTMALAACGRTDNKETTPATTAPITTTTTIPSMDPTLGTNIPDPSVDTSMPDITGSTDDTIFTENSGMTETTLP